jgi:hypothetical protein
MTDSPMAERPQPGQPAHAAGAEEIRDRAGAWRGEESTLLYSPSYNSSYNSPFK